MHDFLSHYIGSDSRLLRTVRLLLWNPGQLTLNWQHGRRQDFITPGRLFLSLSLVFFFFYSLLIKGVPDVRDFLTVWLLNLPSSDLEAHEESVLHAQALLQAMGQGVLLTVIMSILFSIFSYLVYRVAQLFPPKRSAYNFGVQVAFSAHIYSALLLLCMMYGLALLILSLFNSEQYFQFASKIFVGLAYLYMFIGLLKITNLAWSWRVVVSAAGVGIYLALFSFMIGAIIGLYS